jgi:Dolichyl-phosphate-mannose-protein mannosyltransferase
LDQAPRASLSGGARTRAVRDPRAKLLAPSIVVALVLVAFSGRYGYHRDELYFLAAGDHLAWGYPDMGPVVPAIAALADAVVPDSLVVLRIPSALAAAATVGLTGLLARELGGGRRARVVASSCAAVATLVLTTGHLLSTATFDLLAWTLVAFLVVRAVRTGESWLWPVAGAVVGVALLNKPLIAFLVAGLAAGVAIAGPRSLLRDRWVWAGAGIAFALWLPWLVWQAAHGWPQLEVSQAIASGGSASSEPRWALLPYQLLLVSPLLAPVWIAGLVRLFRDPDVRPYRFLGWSWVVLAGVFLIAGGKPYYLGGLLPALVAAGAAPVDRWLDRGWRRVRRAALIAAIALSGLAAAIVSLPVLPVDSVEPVVALNPDVGETIGWPDLVATVAAAARDQPSGYNPVILTRNYGEAGAIDRFGKDFGLPSAYSGHNAYAEWGPPPDTAGPVIVVGEHDPALLERFFDCQLVAEVSNRAGVENEESGVPVWGCAGSLEGWQEVWPRLRRLG